MKSTAGNDNRVKQKMHLYFKHVTNFRDKLTHIETAVMLFTFVILISQFLETDMFSIEMDPCVQFCSSKSLQKTLTFKFALKRIFTSSSVIEYL